MTSVDAHDRVCLVIAHPDDETLFFIPTLSLLKTRLANWQTQFFIFCCTNGSADGDGERRQGELESCAATILDIPVEQVKVLNRPEVRDGHRQQWDISFLVKTLTDFVQKERITWLLTFDNRGVSRHPNHIACWRSCVNLLANCHVPHLRGGLQVTTLPIGLKYLGLIGAISWIFLRKVTAHPGELTHLIVPSYSTVIKGMKCHRSQFVWYRWLFALFSTYSVFNEVSVIDFDSIHVK